LALPNVTACDYGKPDRPKSKFSQPPYQTSKSISIDKARDIAEAAPEEDNISVHQVGLFKNNKSMAQPKGLNNENLFAARLSDDDARFDRLEQAVQALSDKIAKMSPTIAHLSEIDNDLENLTYQLEVMVNERDGIQKPAPTYRDASLKAPSMKPSPAAPVKKEAVEYREAKNNTAPQDIEPASGNPSAGYITESLRVADHEGKTRLVFEGPQKINVDFVMNDNGRSATATIEGATIDVDPQSLSRRSSLIKYASIKDNTLQLMLTDKSQKVGQGYLPPTPANPNHRVYIDLSR